MARWNEIVFDKKSESAAMLRAMLSSAIFQVEPVEFARAEKLVKEKLVKAGKLKSNEKPSRRQVVAAARSVIPNKD